MYISPTDDPQDTLAAHLPEGYPWGHEAPPPTEPAGYPGWNGVRPIVGIVEAAECGDDPLPSMRGAALMCSLVEFAGEDEEPRRAADGGEDDETERRNLDAADLADERHDEEGWWV